MEIERAIRRDGETEQADVENGADREAGGEPRERNRATQGFKELDRDPAERRRFALENTADCSSGSAPSGARPTASIDSQIKPADSATKARRAPTGQCE